MTVTLSHTLMVVDGDERYPECWWLMMINDALINLVVKDVAHFPQQKPAVNEGDVHFKVRLLEGNISNNGSWVVHDGW